MKKLLIAVCLVVAMPVALVAEFKNLPKAIEKADKGTVLVRLSDKDKTLLGSGISIVRKDKYYVWTDAHVVKAAKFGKDKNIGFHMLKIEKSIVKDGDIVSTLSVDGGVIAYDEQMDIALLELSDGDTKYFSDTKFYLEDKVLPRGTDILFVANFLDYESGTPGMTGACKGTIGGYGHKCSVTGQKFDICLDGSVIGGCSGSGVYIEDGRCVGIVCRMWATNAVLYSPIREIKKWAEKNNLMWALDDKVKKAP